jgi:uncharacterized repeat protein (TIGR01451 family)
MKKHAIWLIVFALILSTAVAVAATEPSGGGTVQALGSLAPLQGAGGGCTIGAWTPIDSLTTARSRTAVAYSPATGSFFVLGGEASGGNRAIPIEEYDFGTNTWTDQAQLLTGVSNTGAAAVGNYIYVPGGFSGVGQAIMQRYDPVANTVSLMTAMPGVAYATAVTALGTDVYVLGGSSTGAAGTTNYIYDTTTDTWSTGAPLPTAVQYPAATSDGTYVYVLGGNTTNITTVQVYDPVANSWSAGTPMNVGRGGPGAFFDGQNVWAVAGGWATYLTSTEYWSGGAWEAGPSVNTGARTIGAAYADGFGMKAGGWNGSYSAAAETISIDCGIPDIAISKSPDFQTVTTGGTADFTITVTNTGTVTLTNVAVADAMVPACDSAIGTMAPGDFSSYTCSDVTVTGSYTNTAVVTSEFDGEPGPSASDDAYVEYVDAALAISKGPDTQTVTNNGIATFTIVVTNTGTLTLSNVTVSDALAPDCDSALGTMGPGATSSYTCNDMGSTTSYTNTAVVTSQFVTGGPGPTASDDAFVEVLTPTGVSLTGFGGRPAALSPLWLVAVLALVAGFGLLLRRRLQN